mmetsp:Transcript_25650/g.87852  ORF Transcript_25650/g.87852 Transcript_25650/m.87852 type:complete len:146 (-) Transcript_25650:258-695(-)
MHETPPPLARRLSCMAAAGEAEVEEDYEETDDSCWQPVTLPAPPSASAARPGRVTLGRTWHAGATSAPEGGAGGTKWVEAVAKERGLSCEYNVHVQRAERAEPSPLQQSLLVAAVGIAGWLLSKLRSRGRGKGGAGAEFDEPNWG